MTYADVKNMYFSTICAAPIADAIKLDEQVI